MKRIIYILLTLVITLSLALPVVAYASEPAEEGEPPSSSEVIMPDETVDVDVFTRLYEAFIGNKTEVFSLLGSGILLVLSIILKKDLGAVSNKIIDNIAKVLSKSDVTEENQSAIINGLNEMVDGYNEIREKSATMQSDIKYVSDLIKDDMERISKEFTEVVSSNADLDAKIDKLFSIVISLMDKEIAQNAEVMDVLTSVYENNDALPQGIKDYVALKHAENAKIVVEASSLIHSNEGEGK